MFRKKLGLLTLAFIMVFTIMGGVASAAAAPQKIKVYLDDELMTFPVTPAIKKGVTFVPFRALFEAFDYSVKWNNAEKRINADNGDVKLQLYAGKTTAHIDGQRTSLPAAPYIEKGSTLIPLRFVAEATGYTVSWDQSNKTIHISTSAGDEETQQKVDAFLKQFGTAESERDLNKVKSMLDPESLNYDFIVEYYEEFFKSQGTTTYSNIEIIDADEGMILASVTRTEIWTGGPFFFDLTEDDVWLFLTESPDGSLKLNDELSGYGYYHALDLIGHTPAVPAEDQTSIEETLRAQYEGYNNKDADLVLSTHDQSTWIYRSLKELFDSGFLNEVDYNLSASSINIVQYDANTAIVHAEESDIEGDLTGMYYMVKTEDGSWLIADAFSLYPEEEYSVMSLMDSPQAHKSDKKHR
ncbi:copper amine oxidase N-terminal domain-containing protein [Paenibacillus sp. 453mf]|uniref:copper amine oxidase N-terminal domain-containing protein n=1 Tax=Paenibacillus sp. 453mf TaxID=1761874 RepID=UPI0008DEAD81|nr:copper amine oxidase N-terminal domain-containing protein [Paenibacillus sp. 453mf]SFS46743.1 Copper amine oxidase N-terminal domain-containing protein [Paenibacillus sp. 453mf]